MSKVESMYVGNGKTIGKDGMKISICLNDLWNFIKTEAGKEAVSVSKNGKKYVSIVAFPYREERSWGTHSVKLDIFKPEPKEEPKEDDDDLPF